ncbi:MAG: GntR family transcriptional regulator [Acidobacteriota bacterium]
MRLRLRPGSLPLYQQMIDQLRRRISSGRLSAGDRLPSVRTLAEELTVNRNTVSRAYRELERDGFVVSRHGDGVFVADRSSPFLARDRQQLIDEAVDRLLSEAEQLDVPLEKLVATLRRRGAGQRPERLGSAR